MRRQVRPRAASRVPGFPTRLALRNAPVGKDSPWTSQPPDWLHEGRRHGKGQLAQSPPFTCPSCESPLLGQPHCTHTPPPSGLLGCSGGQSSRHGAPFQSVCLSLRQSGASQPRLVGRRKEMRCGGAEVLVSHSLAWLEAAVGVTQRRGTSRCRWRKLTCAQSSGLSPLCPPGQTDRR